MCELAAQGKVEEARAINARLADVHTAMFLESNPIPVKWALAKMGLMPNGIRLPLTPLDAKYHLQVEQALRAANLL